MSGGFTAAELALLADLGELLRRCDPVPPGVCAAAEAAFALAFVPDEWRILEPIDDAALVRSDARVFRFGDNEITVEVELCARPWRVELVGIVTPVAEVEVAGRRVQPDAAGFFRMDELPSGPLRVVVHRPGEQTLATRWFPT